MALINLRNALMTGKRLPYDAEVEFLQSDGNAYINTGIAPAPNMDYSITFSAQNASTYYRIFGAWTASNKKRFGAIVNAQNILYQQMTPHGEVLSNYTSPNVVTIEKRGLACYVNGVYVNSFSSDIDAGEITDNLLAFAINTSGIAIAAASGLRIYSFSLTLNGTLVRDYIPVRVGAVGYLYDRVSGKFAERHGDFVLGPDVVPVEHLQSSGTQYIDTGVYGSDAVKATLDFQLISLGKARGVFGTYTSTSRSLFVYQSGGGSDVWQVGFGHYGNTAKRTDTERHNIEFNDFHVDIDGETIATFSQIQFTTSHTMTIFTVRNESGGVYGSTGSRCYGSKIWQSNIPVRSFRPVRVGTDATSWEGAMMDVLTRRIYRNAGTGAFSYGNDLKNPIPA